MDEQFLNLMRVVVQGTLITPLKLLNLSLLVRYINLRVDESENIYLILYQMP